MTQPKLAKSRWSFRAFLMTLLRSLGAMTV
jgi:hypothetical protein